MPKSKDLGQIGGKPPLICKGLRRFSKIDGISPLIFQPTVKSTFSDNRANN